MANQQLGEETRWITGVTASKTPTENSARIHDCTDKLHTKKQTCTLKYKTSDRFMHGLKIYVPLMHRYNPFPPKSKKHTQTQAQMMHNDNNLHFANYFNDPNFIVLCKSLELPHISLYFTSKEQELLVLCIFLKASERCFTVVLWVLATFSHIFSPVVVLF